MHFNPEERTFEPCFAVYYSTLSSSVWSSLCYHYDNIGQPVQYAHFHAVSYTSAPSLLNLWCRTLMIEPGAFLLSCPVRIYVISSSSNAVLEQPDLGGFGDHDPTFELQISNCCGVVPVGTTRPVDDKAQTKSTHLLVRRPPETLSTMSHMSTDAVENYTQYLASLHRDVLSMDNLQKLGLLHRKGPFIVDFSEPTVVRALV